MKKKRPCLHYSSSRPLKNSLKDVPGCQATYCCYTYYSLPKTKIVFPGQGSLPVQIGVELLTAHCSLPVWYLCYTHQIQILYYRIKRTSRAPKRYKYYQTLYHTHMHKKAVVLVSHSFCLCKATPAVVNHIDSTLAFMRSTARLEQL